MMFRTPKKHMCGNPEWAFCTACKGRIHLAGCATLKAGRLKRDTDCCEARHRMLYDQGHHFGLDDSSIPMLQGYAEKPRKR